MLETEDQGGDLTKDSVTDFKNLSKQINVKKYKDALFLHLTVSIKRTVTDVRELTQGWVKSLV